MGMIGVGRLARLGLGVATLAGLLEAYRTAGRSGRVAARARFLLAAFRCQARAGSVIGLGLGLGQGTRQGRELSG